MYRLQTVNLVLGPKIVVGVWLQLLYCVVPTDYQSMLSLASWIIDPMIKILNK